MSALTIGLAVAALAFASAVAGMHSHRFLPPEHLSKESRDAVMLGTGMLSVLASLVLGLLIATAKNSYDLQDTNLRSFAADIIVLDDILRDLGDEAFPTRRALRGYTNQLLHDVWNETYASPYLIENEKAFNFLKRLRAEIQNLKTINQDQRSLVDEARSKSTTLLRERWLLIEQSGPSVRATIIGILVAWIVAIFASFGMNAPRNRTVYAAFLISSFAMGSAVFMILELDRPFEGLLRISIEPVVNAIANILPEDQ
jgi:hypothetical protein